ncbi:MAG: hypothetical protein RR313_05195 [Anaerovoracaceae bacterium]
MIRDTITDDLINVMLRQLGASSVKTSPAHINIAKFDLAPGLRVKYLYEAKTDNEFFLQRISPFPIRIGRLYNEQDVISMITADLKKFESAYNSSNFPKFLELMGNVQTFDKEIENLFLFNNVSFDNLDKLHKELEKIHLMIDRIEEESDPL